MSHSQRLNKVEARMAQHHKVYVQVAPDIAKTLDDQDADLAELLKDEGLEIEWESDPTAASEATKKDAVLVILATAGGLAMLTPLIQNVLDRILRRPVLVKESVQDVLKDDAGNTLTDAAGNPRTYWRQAHKLFEPRPAEPGLTKAKLDAMGKIGITIESQTGANPPESQAGGNTQTDGNIPER
jgi:hypothetical protein